ALLRQQSGAEPRPVATAVLRQQGGPEPGPVAEPPPVTDGFKKQKVLDTCTRAPPGPTSHVAAGRLEWPEDRGRDRTGASPPFRPQVGPDPHDAPGTRGDQGELADRARRRAGTSGRDRC